MAWRQAITEKSLYSDCVTSWSISAWLIRAIWLTWPAQCWSPPLEAAPSHSVKDNYRAPQLPSSEVLLHVSNTNKPSVGWWQTSWTERRYSSDSVFSGTQHTADWCQNDHLERRGCHWREEFLTLISFGTAAVVAIVSIKWQSKLPMDSAKCVQKLQYNFLCYLSL